MENVPSVADRAELAAALSTLRGRYRVWQGVLNAAAYGLPQSRQRVLVIGYRHDTGVSSHLPAAHARRAPQDLGLPDGDVCRAVRGHAGRPSGGRAAAGGAAGRAVHHAGLLPGEGRVPDAVRHGRRGDRRPGRRRPAARRSGYARALGAGQHAVANHEPWDHGKDLVERLRLVKEGCRPPDRGDQRPPLLLAGIHPAAPQRARADDHHQLPQPWQRPVPPLPAAPNAHRARGSPAPGLRRRLRLHRSSRPAGTPRRQCLPAPVGRVHRLPHHHRAARRPVAADAASTTGPPRIQGGRRCRAVTALCRSPTFHVPPMWPNVGILRAVRTAPAVGPTRNVVTCALSIRRPARNPGAAPCVPATAAGRHERHLRPDEFASRRLVW